MNQLDITATQPTRSPRERLDLCIQTLEFKAADQLSGADMADALRIVRDMFDCAAPAMSGEQPPLTPGL